jgi:hypothetical protein
MSMELTDATARRATAAVEIINDWLQETRSDLTVLRTRCAEALERKQCGVPRAALPGILSSLVSDAGWSQKDCIALLKEAGFSPEQRRDFLKH